MTKPTLRIKARHSRWGTPDGEQIDVVRLLPAGGRPIAIDYTEIPQLLADLGQLLLEHHTRKEGDSEDVPQPPM